MTTVLRAVCRDCLRKYRAPGAWRCAECHEAWLARHLPAEATGPRGGAP